MYLDIRTFDSSEKASLDISRHLPRRVRIGPVAIITDRPPVFLSVLRKRWTKILGEVHRQYASTLDARKKAGLYAELRLLEKLSFALITKDPAADVTVAEFKDLHLLRHYHTIYIYADANESAIQQIKNHLIPHGLIVAYTQKPKIYIDNLF
jgi:hypothetical protein